MRTHFVDLDTTQPDEEGLVYFLRRNGIDHEKIGIGAGGWDEVRYYGSEELLKEMIREFWDDEFLYGNIQPNI